MENYSIADMAKKYTEYDMIQANTELPEFPNLRTQLLFTFLRKCSAFIEQSELYSLVTSLAQLGLDTHDLVSETNDCKEKKEARSRQLKVLAGDYFSSRFYQLLSQAGQVEMTRQIAMAICEVNRMKMNLYTMMRQFKLSADEYIHQCVNIKMQLYLSFSKLLDGIYLKNWPELLHGYTRCEVLLGEIQRLDSSGGFRSGWAFWHIMQSGTKEERKQLQNEDTDPGKLRTLLLKYNVKAQLFQMLDAQFKLLSDKIRQLDSEKLIHELYHLGEPFMRFLSAPKALEEG